VPQNFEGVQVYKMTRIFAMRGLAVEAVDVCGAHGEGRGLEVTGVPKTGFMQAGLAVVLLS